MAGKVSVVPVERIGRGILLIRRHKVMLDGDLADLYGVPVKVLNQAVKRNMDRFPPSVSMRISCSSSIMWRPMT